MNNLKEKRIKYHKKLNTYLVYVKTFANEDNFLSKKISKMLLFPSDERSLDVADKVLSAFDDFENLAISSIEGYVPTIPIKENQAANWGVSVLKELLERLEHKSLTDLEKFICDTIESLADGKLLANLTYHFLVGLNDRDEFLDYINQIIEKEKGEFVTEINTLVFVLSSLFKNSNTLKERFSSDVTDVDLNVASDFAEEFHALCEKNIHREEGKEELSPGLIKMLRKTIADQTKN